MATGRKPRAAANDGEDRPRVAALLPVDRNGDVIPGGADWPMPAGRDMIDPNDGAFEDESDNDQAPESPADRVMTMLSESSDDPRAYVKVSRIMAAGKVGWCDDIPASEFEQGGMRMLRDKWGAGTYQIILYGTQPGTKRFTIRTRAIVELVPSNPGAVLAAPGATQNTELVAMMGQLLQAITEKPIVPAVDPMKQMTDMLSMMKLMKEATAPAVEKKSSIAEMVDAIKELKGVSTLINPEHESDNPLSMLKDMLPVIQAAIAAKQAPTVPPFPQLAPPLAIQQAQPLVTAHPENPPLSTQDTEAPDMDAIGLIKLQGNMAVLLAMAKGNVPTAVGAEYVADELPDEMIDVLGQENWWEMLSAMESRVIPFQPWFLAVRDAALLLFDQEDDHADTAQPSATDGAGKPGDNAG